MTRLGDGILELLTEIQRATDVPEMSLIVRVPGAAMPATGSVYVSATAVA